MWVPLHTTTHVRARPSDLPSISTYNHTQPYTPIHTYTTTRTHTHNHTQPPTHIHTYTYTHTHTLTHTHSLTQIHTHTHTLSLTHTLSHNHTHTHTHIHTHTIIHTHIHTHTHIYTHTHAHSHSHTIIHIHTHTLTHTHSLTQSYTHTHIHTHIHTHTLKISHHHTHTHIYTHIHTHVHTHTLKISHHHTSAGCLPLELRDLPRQSPRLPGSVQSGHIEYSYHSALPGPVWSHWTCPGHDLITFYERFFTNGPFLGCFVVASGKQRSSTGCGRTLAIQNGPLGRDRSTFYVGAGTRKGDSCGQMRLNVSLIGPAEFCTQSTFDKARPSHSPGHWHAKWPFPRKPEILIQGCCNQYAKSPWGPRSPDHQRSYLTHAFPSYAPKTVLPF